MNQFIATSCRRVKYLIRAAKENLCVVRAMLLLALVACVNPSYGESRIILDETFEWLTSAQADDTLKKIKAAGFNVFVPCVWHGRGTTWPSKLAPREPVWDKVYEKDYDPLAYLILRAHELGIEVHPWFTVALRQRDILDEYYDSGTPVKSFNLHLPEFREYIVKLMMEVVNNYDIDGVNLDYVRTMGVCLSDYCSRQYRLATGHDLQGDHSQQNRLGEAWRRLGMWNATAVDDVVRRFSESARAVKPKLLISVDSKAGAKHLLYGGTDSIKWADKGWIDAIFHMDYTQGLRRQELKEAFARLKNPDKLVLMVGNFEYDETNKAKVLPREAARVRDLIEYAQILRRYPSPVALYELPYLTKGQINQFQSGPFKQSAVPDWSAQKGK